VLLRLEGAVILAVALWAHARCDWSWWLFAALILLPDVSMAGYLANPRLGAVTYNLAHTLSAPAVLAALGALFGIAILFPLAAIWVAHIGLDRMLGYGLKYPTAFGDTHLGRLGGAGAE